MRPYESLIATQTTRASALSRIIVDNEQVDGNPLTRPPVDGQSSRG